MEEREKKIKVKCNERSRLLSLSAQKRDLGIMIEY